MRSPMYSCNGEIRERKKKIISNLRMCKLYLNDSRQLFILLKQNEL